MSGTCGFEVSTAVWDDIVPGAGALIGDVARVSVYGSLYTLFYACYSDILTLYTLYYI